MSDREAVCSIEELRKNERLVHESANNAEIAVFYVDGQIYAISNVCAHMGGPICKGKVQGALIGEFTEPGERIQESFSDELAVACPLHGWEYDLRSGVHLGDDSVQLPTYDVVVEGGTVYLEV